MLKKIVISLICTLMCFASIRDVSANSSMFSFSLDKDTIYSGYNDIYHEDPNQEPNKPKPEVPPEQNLKINIVSMQQSEVDYQVELINENDEVCLEDSGKILLEKEIVLSIPYTIEDGKYKVKVQVDGEEQEKNIYILKNLALESTPYTDVQPKANEKVENLIDGYYMNWVSKEAPSNDKPQEFVFDYGNMEVGINSMRFFTNYGNTHGVKKAEILYYNEQSKEWENIKSEDGNNIFEFHWKESDDTREPFDIKFDKFYETNKIMLRVIESNQGWGNNTVISEVQTWGYVLDQKYNISYSSSQGIQGIKNTTDIEIGYKDYSGKVLFELVNADDLSSLSKPIKYQQEMTNGKLNYTLVIPENVPVGKYKIKIVFDGIEDFSLTYDVISNDNKVFENITKNIFINSTYKDIEGNKEDIIDGDKASSWKFKSDKDNNIKLSSKNDEKNSNMIINKLKIYGNENIDSVTLSARTNRTDQKIVTIIDNQKPEWKTDEYGNYFELEITPAGISFEYLLSINSNEGEVTINELEVGGLFLSSNLMSKAKVFKNGEEISANNLTDNDISTSFECTDELPVILEFDFSPYTISSEMLISTTNFPMGQGIKQMELEIFEENNWNKKAKYTFDYKTNSEYREVKFCSFDKSNFSKMRLVVTDANRDWGKFVFSELYIIGDKKISAASIAESIDEVKQPTVGQTKIDYPKLPEDLEKDFDIKIASSSNENIISLDGKINSTNKDEKVNVSFVVRNKNEIQDIGKTKLFTFVVPRILSDTHNLITPKVDLSSIIKNPGMGWVQYIEGFECRLHDRDEDKYHSDLCTIDPTNIDDYWKQMDELYEKGLPTNILYIRMPWSWFEPEEGKYAWEDDNSELSKLIKGAKERNLELAFRVLLNSASMKDQAAPEWLFSKYNAEYWINSSYQVDTPKKDPYLDDPIFLEKFTNFISAFGKEFNSEGNDVAFIDAMGYGNWGETESNVYFKNETNRDESIKKILEAYNEAFPDVLLGAQYNGVGYKTAIEEYGYVIRRDAFGSAYLSDEQKQGIKEYLNKGVPVYAENCYHHFESMKNNWGNATIEENRNATLNKVLEDAFELHANTLDARVLEDCKLWIENDEKNGDKLIEKFALNGGYRLSPTSIQIPKQLQINEKVTIDHAWINNGVGFLPNKNSHWNNKYKVAFALLDCKTNEVIYQFNESSDNVNPGDWLKDKGEYRYTTEFKLPENIKSGNYKFVVAIVNEKLNYQPDINLAISDEENFYGKWYIIDNVNVIDNMNDKNKLNNAINDALQLDSSKYTKSTWDNFQKALDNAKKISVKEDATIEEINAALTELLNSQNELKLLGNKKELNSVISEINKLDSSKYTKTSWENLQKVLDYAIGVSESLDVSQEEVDKAFEMLVEAKDKLELLKEDIKPEDKPNDIEVDVKPETNPENNKNEVSMETDANQVETGDTAPILISVSVMMISVVAYYLLRRKKD